MANRDIPKVAHFIIVGVVQLVLLLPIDFLLTQDMMYWFLKAEKILSEDPRVQDPQAWTSLLCADSAWQLQTIAQPGLSNRVTDQHQRKMLGGSCAINGSASLSLREWALMLGLTLEILAGLTNLCSHIIAEHVRSASLLLMFRCKI